MRPREPFGPDDLEELHERLYSRSRDRVIGTGLAYRGNLDTKREWIVVRHDVDNVILPAVDMARWEAERGIHSTYFILHGNGQANHYWHDKRLLRTCLEAIASHGHEIGLHTNAIAEALRTGRQPLEILEETLEELRSYGHPIRGVVAHGDPLCHTARTRFVNDEIFLESARPSYGSSNRFLSNGRHAITLRPVSRADYGLEYDPNWLPRGDYLSDSGGRWSQPFDDVADAWPDRGQLHMLIHPDWWWAAFPYALTAGSILR